MTGQVRLVESLALSALSASVGVGGGGGGGAVVWFGRRAGRFQTAADAAVYCCANRASSRVEEEGGSAWVCVFPPPVRSTKRS